MPYLTSERLTHLEQCEKTLDMISTSSPAQTHPGTKDARKCALCAAFINEARAVFDYQALPAVPRTPKENE